MEDPLLWQILLQVVLIALNAVFACAEIAVISMNDNKLAQMAAAGDRRAVQLARLTSQPARFLATIQVAITLSGFMGSAFAADSFSDILVGWMVKMGVTVPVATLDAIAVVVITLVLSYFTLVFGELVPKRIAMKKAEPLALAMATMITVVARLTSPIVWALTASTNLVLRLCGIDPNAEDDDVSEEEIRMMVDVGNQKGVIDTQEKDFIQNVFEFNDLTVESVVTHRTELTMLWTDESDEQWEQAIRESRHSRYPVCEETSDNIVGILDVRDYFRLADRSRASVMANAVKPAYFVPGSVCADVLFRQMKKAHDHMAVVLDEYSGVLGIVTMYDLLEQLLGDFDDEEPDLTELDAIIPLDNGCWQLRGIAPLSQVARQLGIALPTDDFDTFGGFIFGQYGHVPDDGTVFALDIPPLHIEVAEIHDHRLEKAVVCLMEGY